jgi:hypothetical protein
MQDVFGLEPREITPDERQAIDELRAQAEHLWRLIDKQFCLPSTAKGKRQLAIAKTELEASVDWAIKGILMR